MSIHFYSHGACREVTGSKHFLAFDDAVIQLDCGMFQGKRAEAYRKNLSLPFDPRQVRSVILSHAHFDHSGALPVLAKQGFTGNIFATSATRDVANVILLDSAHIQAKDAEHIHFKNDHKLAPVVKVFEPIYDTSDVMATMSQFVTLDYHRPFSPLPGVRADFFDAGHILGSALVRVVTDGGQVIGFSGDLGRKGLPIIRDPETLPELDYLILEGTYGNRLHKPIDTARQELASLIHKALERKSKIIIPAFTVERTQELIYLIHQLLDDRTIPEIPIFVDSPMAVSATAIFKIHPECFDEETRSDFVTNHLDPFGFDQIRYVTTRTDSVAINSFKGPAIIISASGMAESGRILHHLVNHVGNPDNIVAIVGFMAEHTLGRKLVERAPEVRIFGQRYPVRAEIATLNAFSGHADYGEITSWVTRLDLGRMKKIFLVHGEPASLENLRGELLGAGVKEVEIVEYDRRYELN
ncbi:MAG TPA: MBL fold metallo-hydrolase [Candidatus Aminicenantes bacterium]|nr:MBL fold metallo-hydrolase [Candidatus Aminicenantes bacterium]